MSFSTAAIGSTATSSSKSKRAPIARWSTPLARRLDGGIMSALSELDGSKVVDIDLGSNEFKQNARDILAQWAKRPPFYVLSSGPAQVICGRYADVHEIFSDTERFSSELPKGHGFEQFDKFMGVQFITQMDGERHGRIRRLLMPAFSARSLSRLETRIVEIIDGMLDKIEAGGNEFDGMQDYGAQLVVGALLTAMANLSESQKEIFLAFHEVLPLTTYTKPGEPFAPQCVWAFERAAQLVREIIAQRRAHPQPDFINDLITAAVEECLRIASNGYFTFPRMATRVTEVGGTKILKGMVVRPSPQAANYDPEVFSDPLRFDIHRHPKRIMAFGAGPHHCIGNILGRTAITTAVRRMLARFPHARLADPDFVPSYGGAVGELRLQRLPMRIQ